MRMKKVLAGILAAAIAVTGLPPQQLYVQAKTVEEVSQKEESQSVNAPVLDLKFEDNLTDSSSNGAQVASSKGVAYTDGVNGQRAVMLDGSTWLNLGTSGILSPSKLTLSFWIKPNAVMSGEQIITWNKNNWNDDGWYVSSLNDTTPLLLCVGSGEYQIRVTGTRSEFFPEGKWTHIALTYDSATKNGAIYRNGVLQKVENNGNGNGLIGPCEGVQKAIGYNGPIYNDPNSFLNASLDEYRLYDQVLNRADIVAAYEESGQKFSAEEKRALAQSDLDEIRIADTAAKNMQLPTKGVQGSVITWSSDKPEILSGEGIVNRPGLNEPDQTVTLTASVSFVGGETVTKNYLVLVKAIQEGEDPSLLLDLKFEGNLIDSSIYGNEITANKQESYETGKKDQAIVLDGSSWLELGTSGIFSPSKLTLSFWLKPNQDMGKGEQIIAWSKGVFNSDGWYLSSFNADTPIALSVGAATRDSNDQPYQIVVEGTRSEFFPQGEWTHIVVTYDSETKEGVIYRNGLPQKTKVKYNITETANGVIGAYSGEKVIGSNGPAYHNTACLNASLDEYRLYDQVFELEEVISAYEEGGTKLDRKAVAQSILDALSIQQTPVVKNIRLPKTGEYGSAITWTSSQPEIITNDGKVKKRPQAGSQDAEVTFTAATSFAGTEATKEFTVKVKALTEGENPSLLLDLKFEDNLLDSSVYGNEITADKQETYVAGIKDKAISLDGNNWLSLGTSEMFSPSKLTLSFWLKPEQDMGKDEQVIAWSKGVFNSDGWYLSSFNDNTPLALSVGAATKGDNDQPYQIVVEGARSEFFPQGEWTHIVVSYDSETKEGAIYKNGIPQKTTVKYEITETANGVVEAFEGEKVIGSNGPKYNHKACLSAALDEYRIYDKVLGLEEAITVYEESGLKFDKKAVAQRDADALELPATATGKITLPQKGESGSVITWETSDPDTISLDGMVTRPESGEAKTVTLTAIVTFANGAEVKKPFTVTVKPKAQKNPDAIADCGIENVTLSDDYLVNAAQKENNYLLSLSSQKFLYEFYRVSGLNPPTKEGYQGWERSNGTNFRGHTFGHYMSALSQAYKGAKDADTEAALLSEIKDAVEGLKVCQDAYAEKNPASAGYVSAFRESILNKTDGSGSSDENVIVPWYNLHKVLAGLLDIYTFVDDKKIAGEALGIAEGFSEYVYRRCLKLSDNKKMLEVEYGGMNESLYEIYDITGNEHFKTAAQYFDEIALFDELAAKKDVLSGKHANTTIPKLIGALKRYTVFTENEEYLGVLTKAEKKELEKYKTAAENFWDIVINHHTYITGGNSQSEHFHDADKLYFDATKSDYDGSSTCETCNTYNMLKLSRELYKLTKDKKYMDYYENTYINAILSSQNPETGTTMYFQPMAPGYNKVFNRPFDEFWCCTGTGMENFSKLGDTIYFTEKSDVYVNLYFSNTFEFTKQNLKLTQKANIPNEDEVTISVEAIDGTSVTAGTNLRFRIPDWIVGEPTILLNGTKQAITEENGYALVSNVKAKDTLKLTFPMEVKAYAAQDNKGFVAFRYGPVVLSTALGTNNMDASNPNGILVRVGTKDTTCKSVVTVQNMTVEEWMEQVTKNLVRIEDSEEGMVQFQLKNTDSPELIYTPHFMRYKERYGMYMIFEEAGSQASQERILSRKEKLREEEMAIDTLSNFDENNSEFAKNLHYDKSSVGNYNGRRYRDAQPTGWFSYDLQVNPEAEYNYLLCTWYSGDKNRKFDLYINEEKLQAIQITDAEGENNFYIETIEIPKKYWSTPNYKKDSTGEFVLDGSGNKIPIVTVKFQGNGSSHVGGLYGITTTDTKEYSHNPNLSALSFDKGTLSPAFAAETKNYTLKVPKDTESVSMKVSPNTPSGLIRIGGMLIDDVSERLVILTDETTMVTFTASAQDHTTTTEYTVSIVKSEEEPVIPGPGKADKTELVKAINTANEKKTEKDKYTEDSYQKFETALEAAITINGKENASQEEVDKAAKDLNTAINSLKQKGEPVTPGPGKADKTELVKAINTANEKKTEKDKYTEDSYQKFETALEAAITINGKENASQEEVDKAAKDLNTAINSLKQKGEQGTPDKEADKRRLVKVINIANALKQNKDKYTEESFQRLEVMLEVAVKVNAKEKVGQKIVNRAVKNLQIAINKLKEKEKPITPEPVDFSVLRRTIQSAEKYKAGNYTTASYKVLKTALTKAKNVIKDKNATQEQVDQANSKLKKAIKGLVELKVVSTKKTTLGVKETYSVTAKGYTYTTSNNKIAAVTSKGKVTAKKTGKATIKAINKEGKVKVFHITVKKAPSKIVKVTPAKKTLKKGKKVTLKVTLPKGSAGTCTFKSSKPKIASVTSKGVVTAKKKGTAKITVKTYNNKKKTVAIKVK